MVTQDSSVLSQFVDLTMQMTSGNNHSETSGFTLINLDDIAHFIERPNDLTQYQPDSNGKLRQAKANCPWFLPSDVLTSKRKQALESHNNYTCLVAAYSGAIRPPIPGLSGHPFRFNPDSNSGINQPIFS